MADLLHTCPVHGFVVAMACDAGLFCTEEDPERPYGNCARGCGYPIQVVATGRVIRSLDQLAEEGRQRQAELYRGRARHRPANGPVARPEAPCTRTTNHETPAQPAPEDAAPATEETMPKEKVLACEQCEKEFRWAPNGKGRYSPPKRCAACIARMPSAIWCGFKKDHPDLAEARARAANYKPRPRVPAITQNGSTEVIEPEAAAATPHVAPATPDVAPAVPGGLLDRVAKLEQAVLELSARGQVVDELRRVVLGESA